MESENNSQKGRNLTRGNNFITGSQVASILDVSPWKSRYQLFLEIHGDITPADAGSTRMKMGDYAVEMLRSYALDELGWSFITMPHVSLHHPEHHFLLGRPADIKSDGGIVQYKNCDRFSKLSWADGPPLHYLVQMIYYMSLTGAEYGEFLTLFGGNDPQLFRVERNQGTEEMEKWIIKSCVEFWNDLSNSRYPAVDGTQACTDALSRCYSQAGITMVEGLEDEFKIAASYKRVSQEIKELEQQKRFSANRLREIIGDRQGLIFSDGSKATWKRSQDRIIFDTELFRQAEPEMYSRYLSTKPGTRSLRVNIKAGKQI